jgi:hypothetical protein
MKFDHVRQELDAEVHRAGFLNVTQDQVNPNNVIVIARKGSHWIRWDVNAEEGVALSYSITTAASSAEKFKPEVCAMPQVLTLEKTCEVVECAAKAEDTAPMRTGQNEKMPVAGMVQNLTLSCPLATPAQVFSAAEDDLNHAGYEIVFRDHAQPDSSWLTGRAGNHWVELATSRDGEAVSYAMTSIPSGEVVGAPVSAVSVASGPPPVMAPAIAEPSPVETAPAPAPVQSPAATAITPEPPPAAPPVPFPSPDPTPEPATVPEPAQTPAPAAAPSITPPKPIIQPGIEGSHDLIWSIAGSVVITMLVDVDEEGHVTNATLGGKINKDTLRLETAAREALSHWRFEPARQDGRAVAATKIPVQLHFQGHPWRY